MVKVSVVIPVFNIASHLGQCMDSVTGQTLRDIEIICVDDGSTDESLDILRKYAEGDPRVQVIEQANAGPGAARNNGMTRANGEYLIFLDSDDWFEADFLAEMVAHAEKSGADVTLCRSESFDSATGQSLPSEWMLNAEHFPGEVFSPEDVSEYIFQSTHGWPWDKLYRAKYVRKCGFTYPDFRNSQDLVFVFSSLLKAGKICYLPQVFIHHRFNRKSSVSNTRTEHLMAPFDAVMMLKDYMENNGLTGTFGDSFTNWVAGFLIWHVVSIAPGYTQKQLLQLLRDEWFPALGISQRPVRWFRGRDLQAKLLLVRYAPYPVFSVAVNMHNRQKK